MADELTPTGGLILHQALHGYSDGHRQLAVSVALTPRDQKTLLALSDTSGASARVGDSGYLTGYPLSESGYFALARTWPAPEMQRPGCVWTHTLLIEFTDLASLRDLLPLAWLFRRPAGSNSYGDYAKPTPMGEMPDAPGPACFDSWARQVLTALYEMPKASVVAASPGGEVEALILEIWSQQWPRLRRNFRFCTFTDRLRMADGIGFDLQLVSASDRGVRSRFTDAVLAESVASVSSSWLDDAMVDLASPDIRGLRTFFKTLGSDVSGGRESFASLCRLHGAIRAFENNPRSIGDAIAVLQGDMGSQPAVLARSMVAKSAFACVEMLDDAGYEFLWKHIDHIDLRLDDAATSTFFRTAWLRSPRRIAGLPMGKSAIASALNRVWDDADVATLITGISLAPDFADRVVARRSDLTGHSAFWEIGSVGAGHLQFALGDDGRQSAVAAMYVAGRGELAMAAVREFGARIILAAIATAATEPGLPIRPWIGAACTDPGGVAAYLVSGDIVHRWLLLALAHQQEPDAVPNEVGADPWLLAWQRSQGKLDDAGAVFIFAFLLSRALGRHTRSPAELALIAFEATHDAAARGAIPDDAWGLLERRLPRASIWSDWDRCRQIREGIVEAFVDNQLSPAQFACLTERISLFRPLAETAAATSRGRKYLRLVKQTLASSRHRSSAERLRAVEAALD